MTISAGLPEDTKITHVLQGTTIHPVWEEGDQVTVAFKLNEEMVIEVFTLSAGAGTRSGKFHNENSRLEEENYFLINYSAKYMTKI